MPINIVLSRKLGEVRWTQADLARATGIRAATIHSMYHNMVERVTLDHLDLICDALKCDLCDILEWEPNTQSRVKLRTGKERPQRSSNISAGCSSGTIR